MIKKIICCLTVLILSFSFIVPTYANVFQVPTIGKHKAFLYNDWNPNRLNVVVFIDPLCSYCKNAIPQFDNIVDYNVFVYWAPILGEYSKKIINPLFNCENPTSESILHKVVVNKQQGVHDTECDSSYNEELKRINDKMVNSYSVNSVPAIYIQGTRTSLIHIVDVKNKPTKYVNGVVIDWQRYQLSKVIEGYRSQNVALILPKKKTEEVKKLIKQYRPDYVFSESRWQNLCDNVTLKICLQKNESNKRPNMSYLEIMTLLGLDNNTNFIYVISKDGRVRALG